MTMGLEQVIGYIRENSDRYISELEEFLTIPSISTLPTNKADVERAAQWLANQLRLIGFERVEVTPTGDHPMVTGEWLKAKEGSPTVLVYGHYDVQPVDPLSAWESPPFTPTIKGDEMFARGAADMKGSGEAVLKSLAAWMKTTGALPVNVRILFEGEEEIGSPHIDQFVVEHKERLGSSFCLNCDGAMEAPDKPGIIRGVRGLITFDVMVRSASVDVHSGAGGAVPNSAVVLCGLIAGLHDSDDRVTLRGFYDDVRRISPAERADIETHATPEEEIKKLTGVKQFYGERGFSPDERVLTRPTLEVNGMSAGYTGEGFKTIIPATASAKISMRTVPYQNADNIEASLREYFAANAPAYVDWELKRFGRAPYALLEQGTPLLEAASRALEESYGKKPYTGLTGGSEPIVAILKDRLGLDSAMLGCALGDSHAHAPNERLHLPTFKRQIEAYARFFEYISAVR